MNRNIENVQRGEEVTRPAWPIIIGGCHRSGTSLVRRILDAHSKIDCGPEVKFLKDWNGDYFVDPLRHLRFLESARSILPAEEVFQIAGEAFIRMHTRAAELAHKQRWADKNPENVIWLHQWEQLLGRDWVFIHVARNPLDTLASIADANFKLSIPESLDERIEHFILYSQPGLAYQRAHSDRVYRITYECLVTDPWTEIVKLMEWLGEKAQDGQLDFNSFPHQPGLEDPKIGRSQDIHVDSIGRWRNFFNGDETEKIVSRTRDIWEQLDPEGVYPLEGLGH